jgi:hypothetical protein
MGLKAWTSRSLLGDERGNVLILAALGLPLVMGCAGLAVDTTQWVLAKREIQAAADAAATAGVYGLIKGADPDVAADQSFAMSGELDRLRAVTVERSPDGYGDDPFAVRVRITVPLQLTFSSMFLRSRPTITAEAIATVVENGEYCAFAVGSDYGTGVEVKPNSSLDLECGIATNAASDKAFVADASSSLEGGAIVAFGSIELAGAIKSSRVRGNALRQKDPFADTEPPLVPNTGCPNVTVNPDAASRGGRVVLQPGCYGNMTLNGPVSMEAGEYILNRGSLSVGPVGEVTCKSCTFFLTSQDAATDPGSIGKLRIDPHSKVKLSAPRDGPNAGILIYQDRRAAADQDGLENIVGGSSSSELEGLIYFPSETLRIDAELGPKLECVRFIGRRLIIEGRVLITKDCASNGIVNFAGTEVRLVG